MPAYNEDTDTNWWDRLNRESFSRATLDYFEYENGAARVDMYINFLLPGLLQTEQYIRTLYAMLPEYFRVRMSEGQFVDTRLNRQWHVFERPQPLQMHVVIGESALLNTLGNRQMMHEQLLHLERMAKQPHIMLQVLPVNSEFQYVLYHSPDITIFHFNDLDKPDVASFEQGVSQYNTDNAYEVGGHMTEFLRLAQHALTAEDSIHYIRRAADKLLKLGSDDKL